MLARKYKDSGELLVNIRNKYGDSDPAGQNDGENEKRIPPGMTNKRTKARAKATAEATADSLRE